MKLNASRIFNSQSLNFYKTVVAAAPAEVSLTAAELSSWQDMPRIQHLHPLPDFSYRDHLKNSSDKIAP